MNDDANFGCHVRVSVTIPGPAATPLNGGVKGQSSLTPSVHAALSLTSLRNGGGKPTLCACAPLSQNSLAGAQAHVKGQDKQPHLYFFTVQGGSWDYTAITEAANNNVVVSTAMKQKRRAGPPIGRP